MRLRWREGRLVRALALWGGGAIDHRGSMEAVGWAVRLAGGSIGPGMCSCPIPRRGLGDTELEGEVVFSRSRRVPGRVVSGGWTD